MIVRKISIVTGAINYMDLNITNEQFMLLEQNAGFVQRIVPELTACEREFLITGMSLEEQENIYGGDDA